MLPSASFYPEADRHQNPGHPHHPPPPFSGATQDLIREAQPVVKTSSPPYRSRFLEFQILTFGEWKSLNASYTCTETSHALKATVCEEAVHLVKAQLSPMHPCTNISHIPSSRSQSSSTLGFPKSNFKSTPSSQDYPQALLPLNKHQSKASPSERSPDI